MSIQMLSRRVAALFFVALAAGCSSTKTNTGASESGITSIKSSSAASARATDDCSSNRRKCIYKGSYEPGERGYAEQEAKRLNTAELERLRRSFGN